MANNDDDQLRRFEFFDFIVVLAKKAIKMIKLHPSQTFIKSTKKDQTVSSMLELLIKKHVLFHTKYRMRSQMFREKALWSSNINDFYQSNNDFFAKRGLGTHPGLL